MEMNRSAQLSEYSQGIKVHPRLTKERRSVRRKRGTFFGSLLLFGCSLACFLLFGSFFRPYSLSWILVCVFMFVVASVFWLSAHGVANFTKHLSALELLEARRQAVLQNPHLFPTEQLAANADALPLPFTPQQTVRRTRLLGSLVLLMPAVGLLVWGWQRYYVSLPTPDVTSFQLMASGGVCTIAMLIDLARRYRAWREQLMLTEDGLAISNLWGRRRIIPWGEARLFAFDECLVRGKKSFTLLFELSSASDVIYWEWVVHINTALPPQTDLPFFSQGHDHQLEAILSLIAGRTGLRLYDLQEYKVRKPR
jgi:hypothetical protein